MGSGFTVAIGVTLSTLPGVVAADPPAAPVASVDLSVTARADQASLRDLPSSGTVWSFLETVEPAAIVDRISGAGLFPAEPALFSMRGTSWTQNAFHLDGADITDPMNGGLPLFLPDLDALERVEATSALPPAAAGVPGVAVVLASRVPEASWHGVAQARGVPSGFEGSVPAGGPAAIARLGSLADGSVLLGGPVAGDAVRLLGFARLARAQRYERGKPFVLEDRLASGIARLSWTPGPSSAVRLLGGFQAISRPFAGRALFDGAAVAERVRAGGATLGWTRGGSGPVWSAFTGLWTGTLQPRTGGQEARATVDRVLAGPISELALPARSRRSVWSGAVAVAPRPRAHGRLVHRLRFGTAAAFAWSRDSGPAVSIPESVNGVAARLWDYTAAAGDSRRHRLELSAWWSDRLAVGERAEVEPGLRLEHTSGRADGAAQGVSWTALLPRLSGRLLLAKAGRLTLLTGWGESAHRLLLSDLAFGDPNAPRASVYRWSDADGDGRYQPSERGALVSRGGPGTSEAAPSAIDPRLRPPRTREVVAGLEASPGRGWLLRFTGFDRRERDLLESVDVGVPASAWSVRYLPDPGGDIAGPRDDQLLPVFDRRPEAFGLDSHLLTNPAGHRSRHQAVELRVEKALGGGFAFVGGATASRTEIEGASRGFRANENDQGLVGELYDDPNANVYARGRSFFDRAFTIKLGAAWRAPGDWRLGLVARYQDGQPFARLVVVTDLAQGPEIVQATPRGQIGPTGAVDPQGRPLTASGHRFSYTLTLDGRVEKGVALGGSRLALVLEGFNLLGMRNEVEEDAVSGDRFRVPTAVQPPRTLRVGARVEF